MSHVKYIPYWCIRCGDETSYPDCGSSEVYIRCFGCSANKPIMFVKNKLVAVKMINDARMYATLSLCKLTGKKFEDIFDTRNIGSVFNKWIEEQEKKRRR